MSEFYCIVTTTGLSKLAAAQAAQTTVALTHFAVGDSSGAYYDPLASQTALVNEVWRNTIESINISPNNNLQIVVSALIPASSGGFDIREAGIFDSVGDLFAIAKYPLTNKPAPGSGSERDIYIRMILELANAASVAQTIDPSIITLTREDLNHGDWKNSVRAATVASNVNLSAAPTVIDGVTLAANDRVLVKNQTTAAQNGIYTVQTLGSGSNGLWVRATDADSNLDVTANLVAAVESGTVNADSVWMLTTAAPIVLGTTALAFAPIYGPTGVTAGSYTKVTVSPQGHVTAGENPTTLAGYGITDAETPAGAQSKVDIHAGLTTTHGATSAATASRMMIRDSSGRSKIAAPAAADDIAQKATVDAHATRTDNPHAVTAAQAGAPPTSRTLTAGNGLTGGGDLSANRTLTLGTPGTLSGSTTNAVSAESHTHAVSAATTTLRGVVELCTNAEALAGLDTSRAVTSAGLASGTTVAPFGIITHPGGVKEQWGTVNFVGSSGTNGLTDAVAIVFPEAFSTAIYSIVIGHRQDLGARTGSMVSYYANPTLSGMLVGIDTGDQPLVPTDIGYRVIGK